MFRLTNVGQQLADLPLDPRLGKALIASIDSGCTEEVAVILAVLSVQSIWFSGQGVKALDLAKRKWVLTIRNHAVSKAYGSFLSLGWSTLSSGVGSVIV